jgi:hypothetical protein
VIWYFPAPESAEESRGDRRCHDFFFFWSDVSDVDGIFTATAQQKWPSLE